MNFYVVMNTGRIYEVVLCENPFKINQFIQIIKLRTNLIYIYIYLPALLTLTNRRTLGPGSAKTVAIVSARPGRSVLVMNTARTFVIGEVVSPGFIDNVDERTRCQDCEG